MLVLSRGLRARLPEVEGSHSSRKPGKASAGCAWDVGPLKPAGSLFFSPLFDCWRPKVTEPAGAGESIRNRLKLPTALSNASSLIMWETPGKDIFQRVQLGTRSGSPLPAAHQSHRRLQSRFSPSKRITAHATPLRQLITFSAVRIPFFPPTISMLG